MGQTMQQTVTQTTIPAVEPFNPATVLAGAQRPDFEVISRWVPAGVHVLDLGCGDGTLLSKLIRERGVTGYGIDYVSAIARGRVAAVQFHPERSQQAGLYLLKNFGAMAL